MRKLLLITLLSLIMASIFCAGYTQYNDTGHPSSLPSLDVELRSDGNTLGFGFSSTDPKSTSGITNITEMPLSLSSKLDPNTGKITLIGSTSFYIWWQIQLPKEDGKEGYSFYVRKEENLVYGEYTIPYTATRTNDNAVIDSDPLLLDEYITYSESSIHNNSYQINVVSSDASNVPYGTVLSSTITLEVKTK
ncbi:MAG: hypothetical protein PUD65_11100 [Spirochaetales bacterium]|nr:hypothetical protein [Spirochaetales bacterium]